LVVHTSAASSAVSLKGVTMLVHCTGSTAAKPHFAAARAQSVQKPAPIREGVAEGLARSAHVTRRSGPRTVEHVCCAKQASSLAATPLRSIGTMAAQLEVHAAVHDCVSRDGSQLCSRAHMAAHRSGVPVPPSPPGSVVLVDEHA
jgi:hypothetical protein